MRPLAVISFQQPYATLVAAGAKTVDTRKKRCEYRGLVAIHASKNLRWLIYLSSTRIRRPDNEAIAAVLDAAHRARRGSGHTFGAIVAVARLIGCLPVVSNQTFDPAIRDSGRPVVAIPNEPDTAPPVIGRVGVGGVEVLADLSAQRHYSLFGPGKWALLFADAYRLPEPVACNGAPAVPWWAPSTVAADVLGQARGTPALTTPTPGENRPARRRPPRRVQLRRTKGWRLPDGAVAVARPGRWGNPFTLTDAASALGHDTPAEARPACVEAYRQWLTIGATPDWHHWPPDDPHGTRRRAAVRDTLHLLAGRDLACWCALDKACHADVLLDLANPPRPEASEREVRA